ncbi:MAG: hypothetical protein Q9226_007972 [Calogaya cf. arnoldii]
MSSKHGHTRFRRAVASPTARTWGMFAVWSKRCKTNSLSFCRLLHSFLCIWLIFSSSKDARESRITTIRITEQCAELDAKNTMITNQLRAQDKQSMSDRLMRLKRLLNLSCIDGKQPKVQYEEALKRAFEFNKKRVPKYRDVLGLVERDTSFQNWKQSEASSVLILSGHCSGTQPSQRFCWVSAAAIGLIDSLQKTSKCHVAFFTGQVGTTLSDWQARSTDREALHSVIYQAASWDLSRLQKIDYEEQIVHKDWDSDNLRRKTKLL